MKSQSFDDIKKLLLKRRAALLKADRGFDREIRNEIESRHGDDVDVAESAYEQEMAYMFKNRGQEEVRLIDEALIRIEKGEYGVCAECGEKISKKRLQVRPYSIMCVECQQRVEKEEADKFVEPK